MSHCPCPELLKALIDDRLGGPEAEAVEAHVETCTGCQQALDQMTNSAGFWKVGEPNRIVNSGEGFLRRLETQPPTSGRFSPDPDSVATRSTDSAVEKAISESPEPLPIIEGYNVLSELGRGGMGVVYKAWNPRLGRHVALKVLPQEDAGDTGRLERFRREGLAVSALNHPFICTLYDVGQVQGRPFLIMEWIEGKPLRDLVGQRLTLTEVVRVAAQVAQALQVAHAAGIIHRDIKPENIMVRADGYVKLVDFGLARSLPTDLMQSEESPAITDPGTFVGTVRYVSPEQARAEPVSSATDIFSLGIVLYELVTGQHPFPAASKLGFLHTIASQTPLRASRLNPEIPQALDGLLHQMLAKEARLRPTASELAVAFAALSGKIGEFRGTGISPLTSHQVSFQKDPAQPQARQSRRKPRSGQPRKAVDSLAVLPLFNASEDSDLEYLSDGISESIIRTLSQLPKVRVMARSTVFRFKGRDVDACAVGRELNVRAVLTGRVLQRGDRLILRAELVDTTDGAQLWGEQYNRPLMDLLAVEEEMAREIVGHLRLRLTGSQRLRLHKRPTINTEAYQFYLRGRFFWNQFTEETTKKAIECFRQALAKDPDYALAYVGLADTYCAMSDSHLPPREALPLAKEAARKALVLDPTLAEALTALARIQIYYDLDWEAAEKSLQRALELNPNYALAHNRYGCVLVLRGRLKEALGFLERAAQLDPLNVAMAVDLSLPDHAARRHDLANIRLQKALVLDPGSLMVHVVLGMNYLHLGDYDEALAALQKARQQENKPDVISCLGAAYARAGKRAEALETLEDLRALAKRRYVAPWGFAMVYAALEDHEEALAWLQKAYDDRSTHLVLVNLQPLFDGLRPDPRFQALLRKLGLPATETPDDRPIDSLAILPFVNAAADPNLDYLSDGITESLINLLSRLPKLRVMARSTVFRYKGQGSDAKEVGRVLNVRAVLTGELVQRDNRVIIKTELVNVQDGSQLWSEHYNRPLAETAALEGVIASEIAERLRLRLTGTEKRRMAKRYTENAEAYQLYLKGRYHWNKRTEEGLKKAVQRFEEALAVDPNYALAYAGLADCYNLPQYGALSPREAGPRAKAAAAKALEIDDHLTEAHTALAFAKYTFDWDWAGAEREYKRAIELNPNYARAHHGYSSYLMAMGRFDEALAESKRAEELDPLSLIISLNVGTVYYSARRHDQAIAQFKKTLELDARFAWAHYSLGLASAAKGMYPEALAALEEAWRLEESPMVLSAIGYTIARSGQRAKALQVLDQLQEIAKQRPVAPYDMAMIYAALDDNDRAFACLERAYEDRGLWLTLLRTGPRLDSLRSDPRFAELLRRMNFPPETNALSG